MGPIPRGHFNPPDGRDTPTTATVTSAVLGQETTSRETTQSAADREAEVEVAPPVQRTRATVSVPLTATVDTTSQTTRASLASALGERVGNDAGDDSQLVQMCRIASPMTECEDTRPMRSLKHVEYTRRNSQKSKTQSAKSCHRCDHQTLDGTLGARRWSEEGQVDDATARAHAARKRGLLLRNAGNDAPQNDVGRGSSGKDTLRHSESAVGASYQSLLNPDGTENQVWIESPPEAELGPDYIWEAV